MFPRPPISTLTDPSCPTTPLVRSRLGLRIERAMFGARHSHRRHRGVEIVVDDLEGGGIAVVDAPLFARQRMFEQFIFDAVEGQRTRCVKSERLQVAREQDRKSTRLNSSRSCASRMPSSA